MKAFLTSVVLAILASSAFTQTDLPFNPQDGETVVFLGDSITHQCIYTQYVEDFFYTRYPERKIHFHNAGVSGDKAADALARFDEDVAAFEPDFVTVLLGMNDGQYLPFDPETFETYRTDMQQLLDRIAEIGAKPIVMSPTMFDHAELNRRKDDPTYRFRDRDFDENYNALMAFYGGWALEESGRRAAPFVSLWAPLNTHTIEQRRANSEFTMIQDAIHPSPAGQMVMAFEMIFQLGAERRGSSSISITPRGKKWAGNPGVTDLTVSDDRKQVSFTFLAKSLPWVIPKEDSNHELKWKLPSNGREGYKMTKAGHKLSGDRIKIAGLAPGNYEILIDGEVIGQWNNLALGTKIEVQENEATPQYQQALEVAHLNRDRNDLAMRPLRDTWGKIKGLRRKFAEQPDRFAEEFEKLEPQIAELQQLLADYDKKIHTAAQPQPRKYQIRPAK
ncbi:MAG: lysophospholipase L1-like esterase [Verrucomicrobiales bacterium]|jgi:lysophospholipase L1-like esterase